MILGNRGVRHNVYLVVAEAVHDFNLVGLLNFSMRKVARTILLRLHVCKFCIAITKKKDGGVLIKFKPALGLR